eukprot:TRINITY_DN2135_c0_g1_i1.p1 TRINITY_DN2135_c0_g1~~TRINITY_DN2135_c0_g1_i1.p1  ORF type:complete len:292 (+),score=38.50 TRINITY_DN2135_c0_g1_i1:41-877(+)
MSSTASNRRQVQHLSFVSLASPSSPSSFPSPLAVVDIDELFMGESPAARSPHQLPASSSSTSSSSGCLYAVRRAWSFLKRMTFIQWYFVFLTITVFMLLSTGKHFFFIVVIMLLVLGFAMLKLVLMRGDAALASARLQGRLSHWEVEEISALLRDPQRLRLMLSERDFSSNDYDVLLELDSGNQVSRGLTQEQIDVLPLFPYSRNDSTCSADGEDCPLKKGPAPTPKDQRCSICLENYSDGDMLRAVPCLHRFHSQCIDHWLAAKSQCPVCNYPVSVE